MAPKMVDGFIEGFQDLRSKTSDIITGLIGWIYDRFQISSPSKLFKNRIFVKIINEYEAFVAKFKKFDAGGFSKFLPAEVFETYSNLLLKDLEGSEGDLRKLEKELDLVKQKIMEINLKEKLTQLEEDIRKYEKEKDSDKLRIAQESFARISRELSELESGKDLSIILN